MDWMGTYPYLTRTVEELRKRGVDLGLDLLCGLILRAAERVNPTFMGIGSLWMRRVAP